MNNTNIRKAVSSGWIEASIFLLVLVFSAALLAQSDKEDKKKRNTQAPPQKSSQPAPSPATNAPGGHRTSGQPTDSGSRQSGRQPGGPGGHQPSGQPSVPVNRQPSGQPTRQGSRQPSGQPSGYGNRQPSGQPTGQGSHQPSGQPSSPTSNQPSGQPTGHGSRQPSGQPSGYGNRQPSGQANNPGLRPPTGQPGVGTHSQNPGHQPTPASNGRPSQFGQPRDSRNPSGQPRYVHTPNGGLVHRDSGGHVREVHTPGGAVITHRPDGVRRIEMARSGNRVVVSTAHGRGGYIQRPLVIRNREYVQRTYYANGHSYVHVYRPYHYRGVVMHVYTPVRYYHPSFYAWAYNPWPRPIAYRWGWIGNPWYTYYGGYFTPYPYYASPSLWLTDYLIAATLEDAYRERMEAANTQAYNYSSSGQVALTPDVKDAIANEVHRQLEMEGAEGQSASSGSSQNAAYGDVPPMFADNRSHVFVVSSSLEVYTADQECAISEGDVLQLNGAPSSDATAANVVVLASKAGDCRKGSIVSVPLQDLQDMQNHMREILDQGLEDIQSRQGQGGLPPLPYSAAAKPVDAPFAAEVRPDANAAAEISQVTQDADRAEQDVVNQTAQNPVNPAGTVTISLGQTIEEVVATLGTPKTTVDLGEKKIYVYKDMKITFTGGRVSDVQ